jgi:preprotein translocase subunit SecD
VDGNVISAPETLTPILGGILSIQGNISRARAEVLAVQLQTGPLPVDFRVTGVSTFTAPSPSSPAT